MNDTLKIIRDVMYKWIIPIFDENPYTDTLRFDRINDNCFEWAIESEDVDSNGTIGVMKSTSEDEYQIYQYYHDTNHINIIIRNGEVKWWNEAPRVFIDFTYDQMYSLYEMLCEAFGKTPESNKEET